MSSGLINSVNNVQSFISSNSSARPTNSVLHQQSLASSGVLHDKQKDKKLSKNIETVLNKLSSKVSSDKVKSKDSETVADIEQDIGTILSLAKNEGEASSSLLSVPDSLFFNDSEVDDVALKQGIIDVLSIASDLLDAQAEGGEDESFILSLISDLLAMLESLMGVMETSTRSGTAYPSQDRFSLLIEYIDLVRDDLIKTGESRFSDVINLIDQQLEEQRYRDRESMKGFSQLDYMKRKGGR